MKRLSVNQIASAGMRANKRAYRSLAAGIFISVFLVTVLALSVQGVYLAAVRKAHLSYGAQEFILLDETGVTDAELRESGQFDVIGHVEVLAAVNGGEWYAGRYDAEADMLLNRRLYEGRMPQAAGEIAIERSMLENMRIEAKVGDSITLSLAPTDGVSEERSFTLTGILRDQSSLLDVTRFFMAPGYCLKMPAALLHEAEPEFSSGRPAVHRLMTLNRGVPAEAVQAKWSERCITLFYQSMTGELYTAVIRDTPNDLYTLIVLICLLGISLLTASGVGIAQAMESQLARRREEIGMLRAVGATRRQIRRIFGREAWLLALILSPAAIAAGSGAAWLMSLAAPDALVFRAEPMLLLPIALFTFMCILLSASLPLRRASHIMPMGVLRDTQLLRKARRIRPKKRFSAPRLISSRQLLLHPTRQLGAALLVALTVLFAGTSIETIYQSGSLEELIRREGEFEIMKSGSWTTYDFVDALPAAVISRQDIAQLEALPGVKRVRVCYEQGINLLVDKSQITPYFQEVESWNSTIHLTAEPNADGSYSDPWVQGSVDTYRQFKNLTGLTEDATGFTLSVVSLTPADAAMIQPLTGRVDLEAINAGREVLVYAPTFYVGDGVVSTSRHSEDEIVLENDCFYAGQVLNFMQLIAPEAELKENSERFDTYERHDAGAIVGATVGGLYKQLGFSATGIITTPEGAQAMGLRLGNPDDISVFLAGDVDAETEAYLTERIEAVAMRGDSMQVVNNLERARESREGDRQSMVTYAAMALVFLSSAIGMITGGVKRRITSDTRMIGALRAVGADRRAIESCYAGPVTLSIAVGVVLGLALTFVLVPGGGRQAAVSLAVTVVLTAAGYLACMASLKMTVREIMRRTIVENIREL